MSDFECNDFKDIGKCFKQLDSTFRSEINSLREEIKGANEKINAIEGHVEYAQSEFQTLHSETLPAIEEKFTEAENKRLELELWGRKWNLIIRGITSPLSDNRFERPRATLHLVQKFLLEHLGYEQEQIERIQFAVVHRLQHGNDDGKDIIVRLVSLIDRDEMVQAAMKLERGTGFSIVPDLPPELSKLRGDLLRKRKGMSESDKRKTRLIYLSKYPYLILVEKKKWNKK